MTKTWVIVADGSRARFFEQSPGGALAELEDLVSPEHRQREGELISDRPGRTFDSRGSGRHAQEPPQTARDHEALTFAKRVADRVEESRIAGNLDRLILVAPPKFLGQLRSKLSGEAQALVARSVHKELTTASVDELARRLEGV